jgi:hypothetical protein
MEYRRRSRPIRAFLILCVVSAILVISWHIVAIVFIGGILIGLITGVPIGYIATRPRPSANDTKPIHVNSVRIDRGPDDDNPN